MALSGLVKLNLHNMTQAEIIAAISALATVLSIPSTRSDIVQKANDKIGELITKLISF